MRFPHNTALLAEPESYTGDNETPDEVEQEHRAFYVRLMRVTLLHEYANGQDKRCTDFLCAPTPSTIVLMNSLRLLFRDEGDGFSILYNNRLSGGTLPSTSSLSDDGNGPQEYLIEYLLRGERLKQNTFWTRFSVVLYLKDPYFFNHTYTGPNSFSLNPVTKNFYFSNRDARRKSVPDEHQLFRNTPRQLQIGLEKTPCVTDADLVNVTQDQRSVRIESDTTTFVLVQDISGEVVQYLPVYVPAAMPGGNVNSQSVAQWVNASPDRVALYPQWKASPSQLVYLQPVPIGAITPPKPGDPLWVKQDALYVNFYKLPRGRYTTVRYPPQTPADTAVWLFTAASDAPLCFIDLLLIDPTPPTKDDGVYPIRPKPAQLPAATAKKPTYVLMPTQYTLRFRSRKTFWIYYVVPTMRKGGWEDLRIVRLDSKAPGFSSFTPVTLNNGRRAYRSISEKRLRLFERTPFHFRLEATGDGGQPQVLVERLPVASDRQILPHEPDFAIQPDKMSDEVFSKNPRRKKGVFSDIYVYL